MPPARDSESSRPSAVAVRWSAAPAAALSLVDGHCHQLHAPRSLYLGSAEAAFKPLTLVASHTSVPRMHARLTSLYMGLSAFVWTSLEHRQCCIGEIDAEIEFLQNAQWEFPLRTLVPNLGWNFCHLHISHLVPNLLPW